MGLSPDGEQATWLVPVDWTDDGTVPGETIKMDGGDFAMFWAVEAAWSGSGK